MEVIKTEFTKSKFQFLFILFFVFLFAPTQIVLAGTSDDGPTFEDQKKESGRYQKLKPFHHHEGHGEKSSLFQAVIDNDSGQFDSGMTPASLNQAVDMNLIAAQLVDQIHDVSHDHNQKKSIREFVRKWLGQMNLVRSTRDLRRWVDMKSYQNPQLENHIANLGVLFVGSHLIEMSIGPSLAAIGNTLDWPNTLNAAFLFLGGVISIPGLDPICIVLAGAYKVSPGFRATLTGVRLGVKKGFRNTINFLKVDRMVGHLIQWQDGYNRIESTSQVGEGHMLYHLDGGFIRFAVRGREIWLKELSISNDKTFLIDWNSKKVVFDRNIQDAIERGVKLSQSGQQADFPFYIRSIAQNLNADVESSHSHRRVIFEDGSIRPRGRATLCRNILTKDDDSP